eukprot:4316177-Pleurochrysis_carterae.AAC.1
MPVSELVWELQQTLSQHGSRYRPDCASIVWYAVRVGKAIVGGWAEARESINLRPCMSAGTRDNRL